MPASGSDASAARNARAPATRRNLVANEILDQAATIFAERGFEGTGIRDIAEAMNMSRPTVYHYIKTKEHLLEQIVDEITEDVVAWLAALRADESLDSLERVSAMVRGLALRITRRPAHMRLLTSSEARLPEPAATRHANGRRTILKQMAAVIGEGVAAGELRPVDERIAAFAVLGMCDWIAWWYRPDAGASAEAVAGQIADVAMNGLRVAAPHRRGRRGVHDALDLVREDLDHVARLIG